jgi:hypothetical protein
MDRINIVPVIKDSTNKPLSSARVKPFLYQFKYEAFPIFTPHSRQSKCPFAGQEGTMHIHGNSMSIQAAGFYSAAQEERAAAAEVRRKLLKGATNIASGLASGATPEETLLIGQWLDSRHSQVQSEEEYHTAESGKDPDFG